MQSLAVHIAFVRRVSSAELWLVGARCASSVDVSLQQGPGAKALPALRAIATQHAADASTHRKDAHAADAHRQNNGRRPKVHRRRKGAPRRARKEREARKKKGAPEAEEGPDEASAQSHHQIRTAATRPMMRPCSNEHETSAGPPYEALLKYLPHDCTEQQVTRFFAGCGALEKAPRILKDRATGRVIRGFVTFAEEQGLQNALQKDGHKLGGRNVSVTVATTHGTCQQEGTHTPAMASEVVDVLGARHSNGVFVDGTFGRGGHSREILKALGPSGRYMASTWTRTRYKPANNWKNRTRGLPYIERPSRRCSNTLRKGTRRSVGCWYFFTSIRRRAEASDRKSRVRSTCASTPLSSPRRRCSTSYELQDKNWRPPWRPFAGWGKARARSEDRRRRRVVAMAKMPRTLHSSR